MGTFTIGETKIRPGEYHRFENEGEITAVDARNGVVAGIIKSNWGPLNQVVAFSPSTAIKSVFGSGLTEQLISEMFKGGANTGYFIRVGTGGTAGNITLKDSATESVNAVTITAKYVGARAFKVTIRDSLVNSSKRECIIYDGTSEFEKITFSKNPSGGEAAALVAAINANSKNFTAEKVADGNGTLAAVVQSSFTAGTNPTVNNEALSMCCASIPKILPYTHWYRLLSTEPTLPDSIRWRFCPRRTRLPTPWMSECHTRRHLTMPRLSTFSTAAKPPKA